MDGSSITLIVSLGVLLLMSACFSAAETAFTSFNGVRLKNASSNGDKRASLVLKLAEDYDGVLTTLLIGNNIVNITAASIGTVIFTRYFGHIGVTVSTVVVTILVLIFGEIFPKSLAKASADQFVLVAAPVVRVLMVVFAPLIRSFSWGTRQLSRRLNVGKEQGITEEELLTIVEEAQIEGGINEQEGELIRSVIEFDDLEVGDIVTPRVDVVAVADSASAGDILEVFRDSGYSRIPVYQGSIDEVVGIINQKDFHNEVVHGTESIAGIIKPAIFVTTSMKLSTLMSHLQQSKSHIAVVTDEYGGTLGIVTMEDIIEELVGEIWDEHDEVVEEIEQLGENEYRVLATANLEKLFRTLNIDDDEVDATTVGGWVLEELGRVPQEGDQFDFGNLSVTISKTSARRVLETIIYVSQDLLSEEEVS
ncbi:MAG: hemolysin family protein [Bacillota bacterium]|jgi:CBS domain containing-hemolysin-like protein|nr:hemolysin family protein [Bacillota bacterium]HHT90119.1 HlyC/CorC family transporter [Bacillota bacterium]